MKKHELPEFQVIRQKEANAKFFVASSGDVFEPKPSGTKACSMIQDQINFS